MFTGKKRSIDRWEGILFIILYAGYLAFLVIAEIKHHFAWRILRAGAAEPFIRNFLWAYCQKFRDPESTFREITYRNRFFMSLGELRIARNRWLPWKHRKWLAEEALRCLQP
jgi:hypothetical protein